MADQDRIEKLIEKWRADAKYEAARLAGTSLNPTAMVATYECCADELEEVLASPGPENELAKYGCHECGQDFSNEPFHGTVQGYRDRRFFFCSPECRVAWALKPMTQGEVTASPGSVSDQGWREIASAPKDADLLLLWADGEGVQAGYWDRLDDDESKHRWIAVETQGLSGGGWHCGPTHWRELPAPPVSPAQPKDQA